jgi:hypothetical protein
MLLVFIQKGLLTGSDGVIYFADSPNNSAKFLAIREVPIEDLVVIKVDTKHIDLSVMIIYKLKSKLFI